jgi:cytochrome c
MKKLTLSLTAFNLFFLLSCGSSEKKPGEEYYDPDYKPQVNQSTAPAAIGTSTPATTTPTTDSAANTTAAAENTTANGNTQEMPNVTKPVASGTKIEGAPKDKNEVVVAAVPKGDVKPSPAGKSFDKGKTLISKSDCLACHQDNAKLVGPSYVEVAQKYEANAKNRDYLAEKIIKGGAGAWGQIPMSPHPTLSKADAGEMVDYILSLKK